MTDIHARMLAKPSFVVTRIKKNGIMKLKADPIIIGSFMIDCYQLFKTQFSINQQNLGKKSPLFTRNKKGEKILDSFRIQSSIPYGKTPLWVYRYVHRYERQSNPVVLG